MSGGRSLTLISAPLYFICMENVLQGLGVQRGLFTRVPDESFVVRSDGLAPLVEEGRSLLKLLGVFGHRVAVDQLIIGFIEAPPGRRAKYTVTMKFYLGDYVLGRERVLDGLRSFEVPRRRFLTVRSSEDRLPVSPDCGESTVAVHRHGLFRDVHLQRSANAADLLVTGRVGDVLSDS
jgi:hypothetical protein